MSSPIKSIDFHVVKVKPKQYHPLVVNLICDYKTISYNYNRYNKDHKITFNNYNKVLSDVQNYEQNYLYGILHILQNIEPTKRTININLTNVYTKTFIKEFLNKYTSNTSNINNDIILQIQKLQSNINFDVILKNKL
jgi:hypothetical protein